MCRNFLAAEYLEAAEFAVRWRAGRAYHRKYAPYRRPPTLARESSGRRAPESESPL